MQAHVSMHLTMPTILLCSQLIQRKTKEYCFCPLCMQLEAMTLLLGKKRSISITAMKKAVLIVMIRRTLSIQQQERHIVRQ